MINIWYWLHLADTGAIKLLCVSCAIMSMTSCQYEHTVRAYIIILWSKWNAQSAALIPKHIMQRQINQDVLTWRFFFFGVGFFPLFGLEL